MNWLGDYLSERWEQADKAERQVRAKVDLAFAEMDLPDVPKTWPIVEREPESEPVVPADLRYADEEPLDDPVCPDCGGEGRVAYCGWPDTCEGCGGRGTL
jgi:hypothetical protein